MKVAPSNDIPLGVWLYRQSQQCIEELADKYELRPTWYKQQQVLEKVYGEASRKWGQDQFEQSQADMEASKVGQPTKFDLGAATNQLKDDIMRIIGADLSDGFQRNPNGGILGFGIGSPGGNPILRRRFGRP